MNNTNPINYVAEWIKIFDQVLDWSPHRTMRWVNHNDLERGLDEYVDNDEPLYWAIPEFIPVELRRELEIKDILSMQHDIWQLYVRSTSNSNQDKNYRAFRNDLKMYLMLKYNVGFDQSANV